MQIETVLQLHADFGYVSLFEVIGIVAAYVVQSCYACGSCTVQIETVLQLHADFGYISLFEVIGIVAAYFI